MGEQEKVAIPPDVMQKAQAEMEARNRAQRVAQMIQALLKKERCEVVPSLTITPRGNEFGWNIIALPLDD